MSKVRFEVVDDKLLSKLRLFPDELMLHLADGLKDIEDKAVFSSRRLTPYKTGELLNSIGAEQVKFNGFKSVDGAVTADADHAWEVHETMEPAGGFKPSIVSQSLGGGPEGSRGGWFIRRVFFFGQNIDNYNRVLAKVVTQSFGTLK